MAAAIAKSVRCVFTSCPLQAGARGRAHHIRPWLDCLKSAYRGAMLNSILCSPVISSAIRAPTHTITVERCLRPGQLLELEWGLIDSRLFFASDGCCRARSQSPGTQGISPKHCTSPDRRAEGFGG